MKYAYEIIPERGLIKETWNGPITKQDLIEAIYRLIADPQWEKQMNVIADFRNAKLELTTQEMYEYADWVRQKDSTKYLAIVVSRTLDFGMSRMFEMLTEPDHYKDSRVFFDLADAEQWIELKNGD